MTNHTSGDCTVTTSSLSLLLAPTQAANKNGRSVAQARQDAEDFYNSIGGNKVPLQ